MIYALVYLLFALVIADLMWTLRPLGPAAYVLWWPVVAFGAASVAYLGPGARLFGKRADGSIPLWSRLAFAPFYGISWLSLWIHLRRNRAHRWSEIVPGALWVGQYPRGFALPDGVALVVDLTTERAGPDVPLPVLAVPALDSRPPSVEAMRVALERVGDRPVYMHCAAGQGRSATLAAAWLLRRGMCDGVDEAERFLQERRPVVALSDAQRDALERFLAG